MNDINNENLPAVVTTCGFDNRKGFRGSGGAQLRTAVCDEVGQRLGRCSSGVRGGERERERSDG